MANGLSRDQDRFNCSEQYEINYVAKRYPGNESKVRQTLIDGCRIGAIKNFTHARVYRYIQQVLGLPIP